jgi:hypothetical protein
VPICEDHASARESWGWRPEVANLANKTGTHLVVTELDVLLLGARTLDVFCKSEDTDEDDGSAGSKGSRRSTLLRANVEVSVVQGSVAGSSPLLLGGDGVVLRGRQMSMSEPRVRLQKRTSMR